MPQNLIWLVKWSDRYSRTGSRDPSARPAPGRAGRGRAKQPVSPMEIWLQGGEAGRRLQTCQPTHSAFQCSTAVQIQPQPSSTVNTRNAIGAPHEVRGMSDDLTVMPSAPGGGSQRGESRLFSRIRRSTRLRASDCRMSRQTRSRANQILAVALALPGRCLQVGFDRHQQRLVRDRGLRSPTLCRRLLGVLAVRSWRRTRSGPCPRRRRPAAGRRPDPCRSEVAALIAATSAAPERAEGLRLGLQQFHLHGQLSDPLADGAIQFRLHRIALGVASARRRSRPIAFSRQCSSRKISTAQLARQKLHRLVTQKPQNGLTLARHRPSLAQSQRACRQSLAWGKRWTFCQATNRIYHRPINSNLA